MLRLQLYNTLILQVIPGIEAAVKSMRVGGLRRVIIPPSQGYQNTSQEPIPPNVSPVLSILYIYYISKKNIVYLLLYHVAGDQLKYLQSGQLLIITFCCVRNLLKDGFITVYSLLVYSLGMHGRAWIQKIFHICL